MINYGLSLWQCHIKESLKFFLVHGSRSLVFDKSKSGWQMTIISHLYEQRSLNIRWLTSICDITSCHRVLISEIVRADTDIGSVLELMAT